ncbi:MAG: hypothetical protein ACLTSZ_13685 [Lachnospiraceae bacterium]
MNRDLLEDQRHILPTGDSTGGKGAAGCCRDRPGMFMPMRPTPSAEGGRAVRLGH